MYRLSSSTQLPMTTHIERQQMKTQAKSADTILMEPGYLKTPLFNHSLKKSFHYIYLLQTHSDDGLHSSLHVFFYKENNRQSIKYYNILDCCFYNDVFLK
jgi:hypothetical protein